ncbi:IS30 family transposase [Pseudomonas sp. BP6]|nr:IS30 family transposase [Pseudomonas sp. BP6]MBP2289582.1 IS30 family transposase [Pseudomonas sp. BP7]
MLRERLSPEQIAGKLRSMNIPSPRDAYVCRETIYNAIYALPVGELRKELIICLRQGKTARRPRSGGVDRRGQCLVRSHVGGTHQWLLDAGENE